MSRESGSNSRTNPKPDLLEVGRIAKAHGLKGEVVVKFITDRVEERIAPGTELVVGDTIRTVESARLAGERWLVRFAGVADRNQAELLNSSRVYAEPIEDPDVIFVHEVVGCRLVDQFSVDHGEVTAVVANPASDLLELGDGRLVPFAFIDRTEVDTVFVSVPPGLLDETE